MSSGGKRPQPGPGEHRQGGWSSGRRGAWGGRLGAEPSSLTCSQRAPPWPAPVLMVLVRGGSCKLLHENVSGLRMLCRGNIPNISKIGTFVPQNRGQERGIGRTPFLGQAAVILRWSHVHFLSELTVQKAGSPPWHYSSPARAGTVGTGLPTSEPVGLSTPCGCHTPPSLETPSPLSLPGRALKGPACPSSSTAGVNQSEPKPPKHI